MWFSTKMNQYLDQTNPFWSWPFHFGCDQIIMVKSKKIWSDGNHLCCFGHIEGQGINVSKSRKRCCPRFFQKTKTAHYPKYSFFLEESWTSQFSVKIYWPQVLGATYLGFSPLVPSKWEKNILILLSLYTFWGKSVFTFQFWNDTIEK